MITPIKKENATDQIYMQLLDMIFTGSWSAGSKIPSEAELSKQFGVSRVPVREALQRLNAMGIITSQQGRGAFVNAAPSSDILSVYLAMLGNKDFELKDLLEYRMLVEPYCAKYMAANGTEDFFQNLLQYCPNPDGPDYNESRVFPAGRPFPQSDCIRRQQLHHPPDPAVQLQRHGAPCVLLRRHS